jgi:hypothetical protein
LRLIGYTILLTIIFALIGFTCVKLSNIQLFENQIEISSKDYVQSKVFWFNQKRRLTFSIPAHSKQIRVLLTVEKSHSQERTMNITYLLQGDEVKKFEEDVEFQSPNHQNFASDKGQRYFGRVGGNVASLSFEKLFNISEGIKKLTIELASLEFNVAARVYALESLSQPKAELIWKRAHPSEKQALVLPHIYPADLIQDEERVAALSTRWGTLGPDGVDGVDYQSDVLLVNNEQQKAKISTQSSGQIRISDKRYFTHHDPGGIKFNALSCQTDLNQTLTLTLNAIQRETGETIEKSYFIASNERVTLKEKFTSIQISADKHCILRFFDSRNNEIQQDQNKRTSIFLAKEMELTYRFKANTNSMQTIRVDVRGLLTSSANTNTLATVELKLYEKSANLIKRYSRELDLENNPFEYTQDIATQKQVTVNNSFYITAPKNISELKVKVKGIDSLIKVYARPLDLPIYFSRLKQFENDLSNDSESMTDSTQVWFSINPSESSNQILSQQTIWNEPLEASMERNDPWQSQWVSLHSENSVTNQVFYIENKAIESASGTRFTNISLHESLLFSNTYDNDNISPELVIIKKTAQPEKISLSIDNKEVVNTWIAGTVSVVDIPKVTAGLHNLKISADNNHSYFINFVTLNTSISAHKVATVPINSGVSLDLHKKAENESITIRYFSKIETPHQVIISLTPRNEIGISDSITLPNRVINYSPAQDNDRNMVFLLDQPTQWIDLPVMVHFPLRNDLPEGKYTLHIYSTVNNSGYIQAGYLLDNVTGKAVLFTEEKNND